MIIVGFSGSNDPTVQFGVLVVYHRETRSSLETKSTNGMSVDHVEERLRKEVATRNGGGRWVYKSKKGNGRRGAFGSADLKHENNENACTHRLAAYSITIPNLEPKFRREVRALRA